MDGAGLSQPQPPPPPYDQQQQPQTDPADPPQQGDNVEGLSSKDNKGTSSSLEDDSCIMVAEHELEIQESKGSASRVAIEAIGDGLTVAATGDFPIATVGTVGERNCWGICSKSIL
ncbi:hypothetical protein Syun_021201 [Stephania yunnanensis]|uniref:Uncharacterized protein n=1 Tax=Stephania yunnanensis TaxID=152371 RepID=A0AAP0IF74_9MAGN